MADEIKQVETAVIAEADKKINTFGNWMKNHSGRILAALGVLVAGLVIYVVYH